MNFYKNLAALILLFGISQFSAQAQSGLPAKDIEAVRSVEETYRAAWLKNDEKTILSLFADDAALYPNGGAPVKGKEEIRKFWFAPSDTVTTIKSFEIKIEDVSGDRNYATVTGANEIGWTIENKNNRETKRFVSKGYFISVYVRRGRDWKFYKQFWTSKTEEING